MLINPEIIREFFIFVLLLFILPQYDLLDLHA